MIVENIVVVFVFGGIEKFYLLFCGIFDVVLVLVKKSFKDFRVNVLCIFC